MIAGRNGCSRKTSRGNTKTKTKPKGLYIIMSTLKNKVSYFNLFMTTLPAMPILKYSI